MKHLRFNSYIGDNARAMINWAQHASGLSTPLLTTHKTILHLEGKWIHQLQTDLALINAKIFIHDIWTYPPTCRNDSHIIDDVLQNVTFPATIQQINYCWLYLQVAHKSDITTSDGTQLIKDIFSKPIEFTNQQDDINWPIQDPPDTMTWKVWEKNYKRNIL